MINKTYIGRIIVLATALPVATTASAQTKPRAFPVSQIQSNCARTYSDPSGCGRIAEIVRQRYGDTVTIIQWNSGAGIVRHQKRQGN
ncbi:MAG: hypothetical protein ABL898_13220 [Hyphomicrobiaceae bacterium]|nr:hypothetical protein [Hyphomicrobiaceae bacterium]